MTTHHLKIWPEYFDAVNADVKLFEVRRNDRKFALGDTLVLEEWSPVSKEYTGRITVRMVGYITDLTSLGMPGFVGMGFSQDDTRTP